MHTPSPVSIYSLVYPNQFIYLDHEIHDLTGSGATFSADVANWDSNTFFGGPLEDTCGAVAIAGGD